MATLDELDKAYRRSETFRNEVRRRAQTVTPDDAITLSRGYVMNPNLDPEVLVSAQAGGAAEDTLALLGIEMSNNQVANGLVPNTNELSEEELAQRILEVAKPILDDKSLSEEAKDEALKARGLDRATVKQAEVANFFQDNGGIVREIEEAASDTIGFITNLVAQNPVTDFFQRKAEDIGAAKVIGGLQHEVIDPVFDTVRAVGRGAMTVAQSSPQIVENFARTVPSGFSTGGKFYGGPNTLERNIRQGGVVEGIGETLLNGFRASDAGAAVNQLVTTGDVDMGTGWYPGGTVTKDSSRFQREVRGEVLDRTGATKPWSAGLDMSNRMVQTKIIPRDSAAFDLVSGTIDGGFELMADPVGRGKRATRILPGLTDVGGRAMDKFGMYARLERAAREAGDAALAAKYRTSRYRSVGVSKRMLNATGDLDDYQASVRAALMDEAGMIDEGVKRSVIIPAFAKFLSTGRGRRLAERMVEADDVAEILRLHKFNIGPTAARELADATTFDEVIDVYARGMSPDADLANVVRRVPHIGIAPVDNMNGWIKSTLQPHTRFGNFIPSDGARLDANDPVAFLWRIDNLYRIFPTGILDETARGRYSGALRNQRLREAVEVLNNGTQQDVYRLYDEIAADFQDMFIKLGYDADRAKTLTTLRADRSRAGLWTMESIESGANVTSAPVANYFNQLFNGTADIIKPDEFKRIYRSMSKSKQFLRKNPYLSQYGSLMDKRATLVDDIATYEDDLAAAKAAGVQDDIDAAQQTLDVANAELENVTKQVRNMRVSDKSPNADVPVPLLTMLNGTTDILDYVFGSIWKPLALMRGAYITRVAPEEVARVLMGGTFSGGNFGMEYIGAVLNRGYTEDALGYGFEDASRVLDELTNDLSDVTDKLRIVTARQDNAKIAQLTAQKDELEAQLNDAQDAMLNAHGKYISEALIGRNRSKGTASITRDVQLQVQTGGWGRAEKANPGQKSNWVKGIVDRVSFLSKDPVASLLVRLPGPNVQVTVKGVTDTIAQHVAAGRLLSADDPVKVWLEYGEGRKYWDAIREAHADNGIALTLDGWLMKQRDDIARLAGGRYENGQFVDVDDDVLAAIGTGRFNGQDIQFIDKNTGLFRYNDEFKERIGEYHANPNAPEAILFEVSALSNPGRRNALEKATDAFFGGAYGLTSDKLSRSPTFRRMYWKQMEYLLPNMSPSQAERLLASARKAKVDDDLMARLGAAAAAADGKGTIAAADEIAKAGALRYTRDLLFDASKRGSAMDQMRLLLPFGDAWKEVYSTWARIMVDQRGMPAKHLLKGIAGAKDMTVLGPGDIYGEDQDGNIVAMPDGRREGLFWTNPSDGTLMATFPFSREISRTLSGGKIGGMALDFPVENLNIAGSVVPGVGPALAQAVNTAIPDDPQWDWLRQTVFPFGEPVDPASDTGKSNVLQEQFVPGWLRKMSALFPEEGMWGDFRNMLNDTSTDPSYLAAKNWVYKSLSASGDYGADASSQAQLRADAETVVNRMYALRGLAGFTGPAAPLSRFMLDSKEGNVIGALIAEQHRELEAKYLEAGQDPDQAVFDILQMYGPQVWMMVAPNTVSLLSGTAANHTWFDAYRRNKDAVDAYPAIGAYLLPDDGTYDRDVYVSQGRQGLRRPATQQEMYENAATTLMYAAYNNLARQIGPEETRTLEQRQVLAQFKKSLETYYGVSMRGGVAQERRDKQFANLEELVMDAEAGEEAALTLLEGATGEAVMTYMVAREEAQRMAVEELGLTDPDAWATTQAGLPLRASMRKLGEELAAQDPTFGRLYRSVLENEMEDASEDEAATVTTTGPRSFSTDPGSSAPSSGFTTDSGEGIPSSGLTTDPDTSNRFKRGN